MNRYIEGAGYIPRVLGVIPLRREPILARAGEHKARVTEPGSRSRVASITIIRTPYQNDRVIMDGERLDYRNLKVTLGLGLGSMLLRRQLEPIASGIAHPL